MLACGLVIKIRSICFNVFGDRISSGLVLITPTESASPRPDLLEFTTASVVYIVFKQEISFVLGKSNGQSLVSLNLFVPEQIVLAKVDHVYVNSMLMNSRGNIQPYLTSTRVILLIKTHL